MRSFWQTALVLLAAAMCGAMCEGCFDDGGRPSDESRPISFESSIRNLSVDSRADAAETDWLENDMIGVYMTGTGSGPGADVGGGAPHRHTGGGEFAAEPGHELFFPTVGTVDFTAYHPWRDDQRGYLYAVDVSDQSDPHAIDLKWSNNAKEHSSGDVPLLEFRHVLAKLLFRVTDATGGSLDGLEVVVGGLPVRAVFDLSQGLLAVTPGSELPVAALRDDAGTGSRANFEAIVLPGNRLSPVVSFNFADGTTDSLRPRGDTFSGGRLYIFDVTVTEGGGVVMGGATIVDWDDSEPESHSLPKTDPDDPHNPDKPHKPDDPDIRPAVWFVETMGAGGAGGAGGAAVKIADYAGWDNPGLRITDRFEGAEVRTHGTLGTHIWFPPRVDADVRIEGLAAGYTDITLSYDIGSAVGGVRASLLRLYAGQEDMTPWVNHPIPSPGRYTRVSLSVPDGTTSLRWMSDGGINTVGMRLDNIRLEGTKK